MELIGRCMITLEQAGPTPVPGLILLTPNDIRGMIGNVVQGCVERGGGVGGRSCHIMNTVSSSLCRNRFSIRRF